MTKDHQIQAYNRLQGVTNVVEEMIRLYGMPHEINDDLILAVQALKKAQTNLGWDPGQK